MNDTGEYIIFIKVQGRKVLGFNIMTFLHHNNMLAYLDGISVPF